VVEYFSYPANKEIVERLEKAGLQFKMDENDVNMISQKLSGKTFVISGTFEKFSRDEIKAVIEKNGGKNMSGISSGTQYLIAGNKPGPDKLKKAESMGIQVITEEDFLRMID